MSGMIVEFSAAKDKTNIRKHSVSLAQAAELDFGSALMFPDDSQDYGEPREILLGFLQGTLYVLVYVPLDESHLRAISLRRATKVEEALYADY